MGHWKMISGVILLLLVVVLTGCAGGIVTELYVEDINEAMSLDLELVEPLLTSATIEIESPGEEYHAKLQELLELYFRQTSNFRLSGQETSTSVMADVKVPVWNLDASFDFWSTGDPLGIALVETDDGSTAFGLAMNSTAFDELFAAFSEEFWQTVTIQDFVFTVNLINDKREPVFVTLQGVYANETPVPYEETFEMQRRDVLEVRIGDVVRDFAYIDGLTIFGILEN